LEFRLPEGGGQGERLGAFKFQQENRKLMKNMKKAKKALPASSSPLDFSVVPRVERR
jgi:hypothetical protein